MNRRDFIKTSSLMTLPVLLKSCQWNWGAPDYPVLVQSDAATGHLIMKSNVYERVKIPDRKTLIVGGGVAGMSAACHLKDDDYLLCELSDRLGGSSSKGEFNGISFSQGAHYDLSYPNRYGDEVLQFFEALDIITPLPWRNAWGFTDQQHIITHRRKNHCYADGRHRKDVLEEGELKAAFLHLIAGYSDKMVMPTRLIDHTLRKLNQIDFHTFLSQHLELTSPFVRGLDYHMKDDYGGTMREVSALAGIHYFACRPYYNEVVELFSPPEGNSYFIDKMAQKLNRDQLKTSHLVKSISEVNGGFNVEIVDVNQQQVKVLQVNKIIYAGQKHALKYIYPNDYALFEENIYSPWMVVNVIVNNDLPSPGYWQNEMLTQDTTLMGFVDSDTQYSPSATHRVFTVYYCLPLASRKDLINVESNKNEIAASTVEHISHYFEQDISSSVVQVNIKAMGHAMPIPAPGYLFHDKNEQRKNKNIIYAGVDNSRLPLLYEGVDSGIVAAKVLRKSD